MEITNIQDKDGNNITTKEGKQLKQFKFEVGDKFIPLWKKPSIKKVEAKDTTTGKSKVIENSKLLCKVMDENKNQIYDDDSSEIFVTLTPAQSKSLLKKYENGVDITQHLFNAYTYKLEGDENEYIGVGFMPNKSEPKDFNDFEDKLENE